MKLLLILLLYVPFNCGFQKETLQPKYKIIICVAQSNGVGLATIESQDSGSGAWLWNNSGWEKADGGLNRYNNITNNFMGLSMFNSFGKESAKHSRPYLIGLVVNAKAGSSIQEWRDSLMFKSITRAQGALSANPGSRIAAVLYQQGESHRTNPEVFIPNFKKIREQVDSLLGYDVPMLVGGVNPHVNFTAINDTIKQVVNIHDCYYVTSDGLTTLPNDPYHLDSPSQRIFGLRFAAVYSQIP